MACIVESLDEIKLRLKSKGFRVKVIEKLQPLELGNLTMDYSYWGLIHCYCGRHEKFLVPQRALYEYDDQWKSPDEPEYMRRLYLRLEQAGLNEAHLREDGFTEQEICEIRSGKGEEKLSHYCEICGE